MNILNIDHKKIKTAIDAYIIENNPNLFLSTSQYLRIDNKPILLMNQETLNFLIKKSIMPISPNSPKIFETNIAIANWLSFGEVEIK